MSTYSHLSVLKSTAVKRAGNSKRKNAGDTYASMSATAFVNSSCNTWYSSNAYPVLTGRNGRRAELNNDQHFKKII